MKNIFLFIFLMVSTAAYAVIYVNQSKDGSVEYTDTPSLNSMKVAVPSVNSITTKSTSTNSASTPAAIETTSNAATSSNESNGNNQTVSTTTTYKSFNITSPTNESTIQNQPVISVEMSVEPNMKSGDKIQLILDGKPVGTPTGAIYQELGIVDRGTHTLYAILKNSKGEPIKQTTSITFYVHRNSVITSPATPHQ